MFILSHYLNGKNLAVFIYYDLKLRPKVLFTYLQLFLVFSTFTWICFPKLKITPWLLVTIFYLNEDSSFSSICVTCFWSDIAPLTADLHTVLLETRLITLFKYCSLKPSLILSISSAQDLPSHCLFSPLVVCCFYCFIEVLFSWSYISLLKMKMRPNGLTVYQIEGVAREAWQQLAWSDTTLLNGWMDERV